MQSLGAIFSVFFTSFKVGENSYVVYVENVKNGWENGFYHFHLNFATKKQIVLLCSHSVKNLISLCFEFYTPSREHIQDLMNRKNRKLRLGNENENFAKFRVFILLLFKMF